jgi:penicillin-binding protein 1A
MRAQYCRVGPSVGAQVVMRFSRVLRVVLAVLGVTAAATIGSAGLVVWYYGRNLPDYRMITEYRSPAGRPFVSVGAMPPQLIDAFLSAEDRDFYSHPGIDLPSIARAVLIDALQFGSNRRPIGASTITQQVVRMFLLSSEQTIARKVKEVLLALRIERVLSKDRILELYLNEVYLGCGSRGVVQAANNYFAKSIQGLSLAEVALLAGLPRAPTHYDPWRFPEAAKNRRDWVIDRMVEDGFVSPSQANAAKGLPIATGVRPGPQSCSGRSPSISSSQ